MCQQEKPPKDVMWSDLTALSRHDVARELLHPLPWLAGALALYSGPFWMLGFLASFMFFLCALRLNHEAIHSNLGLARRWDHVIMHGLSALMMGSNHADAFCHLLHHKHTGGPADHEGKCSHMRWYQVLAYGPRFPVDLNIATWRHGGAKWRRLMKIDWAMVLLFGAFSIASGAQALHLHVVAMLIAQCLTAFFAVWITHQGIANSGLAGRSQRGILARVAYLMFYHREHHLFPRVPVSRLPRLARRLDLLPAYAKSRVPVLPFFDTA